MQNRLQNSPNFCVFKYARIVKERVSSEAENRPQDWEGACKARALRARETLTLFLRYAKAILSKKPDMFRSLDTNRTRHLLAQPNLRRRRNLTLDGNVCEPGQRSLF